ncbi:polyamine aminopropyltransferase [Tepiditoga spiralis]|uniref:Polyamine aminopropyltransferase n=1 Tax=Tepiditoga spiralis TaxID=2108365 RepID=A0A7G1G6R6_9BACT|nr:polyamine aminopropyltransferase [Tepiditoga spiralis]BBE31875.1 polyamine aminopropyltransferase [Tepiditoga spiralis]
MNHLRFEEYNIGNNSGIFFTIDKFLYSTQSKYQRIDVFETPEFGRVFTLDGLTMTRESDEFIYHEMITHVPMFIHPNPKNVLIIGGGDGGTSREVLKHPSVENVIMCEIDSDVVNVAKEFLPTTSCEFDNPKLKIICEDGSKLIKKYKDYFDVIIIDSTDPTEGQGGLLFTEEFYKDCYEAMTENGVFSAETEDPFLHKKWLKLAYNRISNVFNVSNLYMGYVPQYPPGTWTWTFASKGLDPIKDFNPEKIKAFESELKYYNESIHIASFALPNFVKELINIK